MFIGVLASAGISILVYHWETHDEAQRLRSRFQLDARERVEAIRRELDTHLQVLRSMGALYQASEQVTREEFRVFARELLEAVPSIQALEWAPRVGRLLRKRYEEQARTTFPNFRITQRDKDGALVAAPSREEYFPVYIVEPYVGNESALGFDLASETVRRETLYRARDSGRITVSGPITLVQEKENQTALLAYLPIYRKQASVKSEAQRRAYLEGFALVVWRVGNLIEHAIARMADKGIAVRVFDTTHRSRSELLYEDTDLTSPATAGRAASTSALRAEYTFEVGGRQWQVIAVHASGSLGPPAAYSTWLIFSAGLLITGILSWYMRALQRYGLEMAEANRALDREVSEHRQTGAALKKSEERFRQILECAADAILISDDKGLILEVNHQTERLFGYSRHELIGQKVELLLPEHVREKHMAYRSAYHAHPKQRFVVNNMELFGRRKDASLVPLEISLSPTGLNEERMVSAIIRDISARKAAEAELRRLNRTHTVLSRCNNSLARSVDEEALLNAFCANLVEVGGYCFAWVGYAKQNNARGVRMVAHAGRADAACSITRITESDSEDDSSPCGMAIRTGRPVVLRDIEQEPKFKLWRMLALQLGYRSMIALPLKADMHTLGNFSIFSTMVNVFNEEEVELLSELAEDLAFGIGTLRARAAHERKVRLLREEVERDTRKRIAAVLHDGVAQSVQAVNLGLKRLRADAGAGQPWHANLLNQIIDDIGGIIGELREVSHELRPLFLERMSLIEAIQYHCSELSERTGITIHVLAPEVTVAVGERVKEQCFLSVREALTNAIKHANASRIDVVLETLGSESLYLRVADDGVGFDTVRMFNSPTGLGLAMVSERAESIGGHARILSTPGKGTRVLITVPLGLDHIATQGALGSVD
jgi:PAS domain S-box-containing protein